MALWPMSVTWNNWKNYVINHNGSNVSVKSILLFVALCEYTCRPYIFISCGIEQIIGMTLDGMISLLNSTTFSWKLFFCHDNFAPLQCLISMEWLFLEMDLNFIWAYYYCFVILRVHGIPTKLVRLIKMCLTETYSRVQVGKNLSDMFPIRIGL